MNPNPSNIPYRNAVSQGVFNGYQGTSQPRPSNVRMVPNPSESNSRTYTGQNRTQAANNAVYQVNHQQTEEVPLQEIVPLSELPITEEEFDIQMMTMSLQ